MKYLISILFAIVITACSFPTTGIVQEDAGPTTTKICRTPNAMYNVTFVKMSGDCPDVTEGGNIWLDENGKPVFPPNCIDHSEYSVCTQYYNENCKTWVYDEWFTGELNWAPGGKSATGELTFTAFVLENGAFFCSSVYQTTFVFQWEAVR